MTAATFDLIGQYKRVAAGKKTFVFCLSIAHAKEVARAFNLAGISADTISGEQSLMQRRVRLAQFKRPAHNLGTDVLCGMDALADEAKRYGALAECVIMLRPTASAELAEQQVMSTRPPHMVLDMAGNFKRLALDLPFTPRVFFSPYDTDSAPALAGDFHAKHAGHKLIQIEPAKWMYRGLQLRHYRTIDRARAYRCEALHNMSAETLEQLIQLVDKAIDSSYHNSETVPRIAAVAAIAALLTEHAAMDGPTAVQRANTLLAEAIEKGMK